MDYKKLTKQQLIEKLESLKESETTINKLKEEVKTLRETNTNLSKDLKLKEDLTKALAKTTEKAQAAESSFKDNYQLSKAKVAELENEVLNLKRAKAKEESTTYTTDLKLQEANEKYYTLVEEIEERETKIREAYEEKLQEMIDASNKITEMYKVKVGELNRVFTMFKDFQRVINGSLNLSIDSLELLEEKIIKGDE